MDEHSKEFELKLRVDPADAASIQSHPNLTGVLRDPTKATLVSVYFDTDDMFMRDHGLTVRVRHEGPRRLQTIKATNHGSGIFERSEWEKAIDGDQPQLADVADPQLAALLNEEVRQALKPVFETRVERTSYHVNGNGSDVMVAFDKGDIVARPGTSCPISEVELELKHGNPAELFKLARSIGDVVPTCLDVKSKSERGYDLAESKVNAPKKAFDPTLSADMSAGHAFTLIGRACLHQRLANEPATRQRDAEALHQMRIALRRLRAAISLFSDVVSDHRVEAVKAELKWLGTELAPARDLDTFLSEALRPLRKQQAGEPGLASVSRMFARARLKSYQRARAAVESARFRALALDTAEWIEAGPWLTSDDPLRSGRRAASIVALATEQLSRRRKKIRRQGAKIDDLDPPQRHRLRIQIKKTRYATEFFSSLFEGRKAARRQRKFHAALKELQNILGGFNDIMIRKSLCAEVLERPGRGLSEEQKRHRAFAGGLIIGDRQAQIARLLNQTRKAHARFDDAKAFWK